MSTSKKPSALEVMFRRKATLSKPGKRREDYNLALVVPGGGMRGSVLAGMGAALSRLRYIDCFDQVFATSAGAIQTPYLLANQALEHAPLYATDIANGRFINKWRGLRGIGPIMDLDYLFNHVIGNTRPLAFGKVLERKIKFHVTATEVSTGNAVLLSDFHTPEELFTAMRASALIPGVGGNEPVSFRGMELIDGGYSAFLPEKLARAKGATHLLVLTGLPSGHYHHEPGYNHRRIVGDALKSLSSPVAETFTTHHKNDNKQLERIRAGEDKTIAHCGIPAESPRIDALCKKPKVMWQGLEAGFLAMCRFLDQPNRQIPRKWKALKNGKKATKKK